MRNDPFFHYFIKNRESISQHLFREDVEPKVYSRSTPVVLPPPTPLTQSFSDLVRGRISTREFGRRRLTREELSMLLFWSAGRMAGGGGEAERRAHPSGGRKYPIELYVIVLRSDDGGEGVYHYNVALHTLEPLTHVSLEKVVECIPDTEAFAREASFVFMMSYVKERSFAKYGARGYKLALIEAGHIGENVYLAAGALAIGCCAMGDDSIALNEAFAFNSQKETLFYGIALGSQRGREV